MPRRKKVEKSANMFPSGSKTKRSKAMLKTQNQDTHVEETFPWDRMEVESSQAYHGFQIYLALGAGRSLDKAFREHKFQEWLATHPDATERQKEVQREKLRPHYAPGRWGEWSSRNAWTSRARAYDSHLSMLRRRENEELHASKLLEHAERSRRISAASTENAIMLLRRSSRLLSMISEEPQGETPATSQADQIRLSMAAANVSRAAAMISQTSIAAESQALGVDELLMMLDENRPVDAGR